MKSVIQAVQALFSGLKTTDKIDLPIGLSQVKQLTDEDVFNHLSQPATSVPAFKPSFQKEKSAHASPAFVRVMPQPFHYQQVESSRLCPEYTGFPRR